jgi:L-asparaginase
MADARRRLLASVLLVAFVGACTNQDPDRGAAPGSTSARSSSSDTSGPDTSAPDQAATPREGLPNVVIFATGGTIATKTDPSTGALVPAVSGDELVNSVPGLSDLANIEVVQVSNIDSSQMKPENWADLARIVNEKLSDDKYIGGVVTHGTDTLADGAYFLDLTFQADKPLAFVGSMRGSDNPTPDGPYNLIVGVEQVTTGLAKDWGVTVTMNSYIQDPRWSRKSGTTNVQTFVPGDKGYLGYVVEDIVFKLNDKVHRTTLPIPDSMPKVPIVTEYSGADGSAVRAALDDGADGLVIESIGAGNVGEGTAAAIGDALAAGVPVVVATRIQYGPILPTYGGPGGGATLAQQGAILAQDLTPSKAAIMLMLALGPTAGNRDELAKYFELEHESPAAKK